MGDLPAVRLTPAPPFTYTVVDYASYFEVKISTRRNESYDKCYIAVFVCMVTKAVHLELVESLSIAAFVDAFQRFTARRGYPKEMFSDRGTNFIGASNEMPQLLYSQQRQHLEMITNELLDKHIVWHFNPAHAPHFGGLWEAAVKSVKYHLKRIIKDVRLTFQQFTTILAQIECCLNSRPLYAIYEDPKNPYAPTPGHFLIQRAPNTLPEPSHLSIPINRLTHYQQVQRLYQMFWEKWTHITCKV